MPELENVGKQRGIQMTRKAFTHYVQRENKAAVQIYTMHQHTCKDIQFFSPDDAENIQ